MSHFWLEKAWPQLVSKGSGLQNSTKTFVHWLDPLVQVLPQNYVLISDNFQILNPPLSII